jgi:hypothetical protein
MSEALHPLAPHHLPPFITAPGETDLLFNAMVVLILAIVLMIGNLYLKLHSMPERMAHRTNRVQFEVVAVLCLLALFTHNHLFWIAGLLLALVQIPDFSTPIGRMADSLERMSGRQPLPDETAGEARIAAEPSKPQLMEVR